MRINSIILNNFRGYDMGTKIPMSYFVAIVGKNDIGKSTILEAPQKIREFQKCNDWI